MCYRILAACGAAALIVFSASTATGEIIGRRPARIDERVSVYMPFDGDTAPQALQPGFPKGAKVEVYRGKAEVGQGRFGNALSLVDKCHVRIVPGAALIDPKAFRFACWVKMDFAKSEGGNPLGAGIRLGPEKKGGVVYWSIQRWRYGGKYFRDWQISLQATGSPDTGRRRGEYSIEHWKSGEWHHIGVTYRAGAKPNRGSARLYVDGECVMTLGRVGDMMDSGQALLLWANTPGSMVDDLVVGRHAEPFTSDVVKWRGFLPGAGTKACRTYLPLYLYFSQPMDPRFNDIVLFDETAGKPFDAKGRFVGDGSVYKIGVSRKTPLNLERRYSIRFPSAADRRLRSVDGALFEPPPASSLSFETRRKGEPPRPLGILIRNNNLQTDLRGTEQALRNGLDIVEINPVKLKDGWVSNHTLKRRGGQPRTLCAGFGGDSKAFLAVPGAPHENTYATYAKLVYVKHKDGSTGVIPHFEDQVRIVNRWDKLIALQGYGPGTVEEYKALYERCGWRWDRVICFHGPLNPCYAKPDITWQRWQAFPNARNWLIRNDLLDTSPTFPAGVTPHLMQRARREGKRTWMYASMKADLGIVTRLSLDVAPPDNSLAFRGNLRLRERLYELNDYEDARAPEVKGIAYRDEALHGQTLAALTPEILLDFSVPMEARSVNYDSARLTPTQVPAQRIPLFIRTDRERKRFTLRPQAPLEADREYALQVGYEENPKAANGRALAKPFRGVFRTPGGDE